MVCFILSFNLKKKKEKKDIVNKQKKKKKNKERQHTLGWEEKIMLDHEWEW